MNRGILLLLFLFLVGVRNGVKAQELQVSDISCRPTHDLIHVGDDAIEVIKEGSNLRIVLGLYQCNPFVTGFDVKATMRKGSENTLDSLSVRIDPVIPDSLRNMNVMQQCYHVMFTIHEVEDASVFFSCLWYEGEVELKQSVVIKDSEVAVTVDDVDYYIYEAKHYATLINGKSVKGELAIPSEVSYEGKEYPVTTIKSQAFKGCSTLTSVTIPNSVTVIEYEAFQNSNLNTINNGANVQMVHHNAFNGTPWYNNQPDGIIYLGRAICDCKGELPEGTELTIKEGTLSIAQNAFYFCNGLNSITIPEGITNIDVSGFMGCSDLISVRLPESLTTINRDAFQHCGKLSSIHIPNHVKYICGGAFRYCSSLTSVNIPEGIEEIEEGTFYGCNQMADVSLPEGLKKIEKAAFGSCKLLSDMRIPDNVVEIGVGAFYACMKLKSITLSPNLKSIGEAAFGGCSDLNTIVCNAEIPPIEVKDPDKTYPYPDVFYNVDKPNCKLYVPKGCEEAYRASDLWKDFNIMEMETVIEGRTPAPSPGERETIYDLQGRKLLRAPQKGIYIQDGKKVVK